MKRNSKKRYISTVAIVLVIGVGLSAWLVANEQDNRPAGEFLPKTEVLLVEDIVPESDDLSVQEFAYKAYEVPMDKFVPEEKALPAEDFVHKSDILPIEEVVIQSETMPPSIQEVNDETRIEAIVSIYREFSEYRYRDTDGKLHLPKIDKSLKEETQIENYPLPTTIKGERDRVMTELVSQLVSRMDGTTNEVEEFAYRIVDKKTFLKWEELFGQWVSGDLSEAETKKEWEKIDNKVVPATGLTKPTLLKAEFPYSASAIEMMDAVLEAIEANKSSTAPHIAFVDVYFDKEDLQYTLYYVESHIK